MKARGKSSMMLTAVNNQSIFISHSSADIAAASTIYNELRNSGFSPWMAASDIPAGANYAEVLTEALESAAAMVVVLTDSGIQSPHVKREVNIAIDKKIPLFPVNISGKKEIVSTLTRDWKYWLSIVQILNCESAQGACTELAGAFKRHGLELVKRLENDFNAAAITQSQVGAGANPSTEGKNLPSKVEESQDKTIDKNLGKNEKDEERLKEIEPIVIWFSELHQWLNRVAYSLDPDDKDFDFNEFIKEFRNNYKLDKNLIKEFPDDFRLHILGDIALSMFYSLIANPQLTNSDPDRAKFLLDIAVELSTPWSRLYKGIWIFLRRDIDSAINYFADSRFLEETLVRLRKMRLKSDEEIEFFRQYLYDYIGDEYFTEELTEEVLLKEEHELRYTWKYWHLITIMTLNSSSSNVIQEVFQEIDNLLSKDTGDIRSKVYLTSEQRMEFKILGAFALFKLERNTAARNLLRGIDRNSSEYSIIFRSIENLLLAATGNSKKFLSDLNKISNLNLYI